MKSLSKSRSTVALHRSTTHPLRPAPDVELYSALHLYIPAALQRSTPYILYTLPQAQTSLRLGSEPGKLAGNTERKPGRVREETLVKPKPGATLALAPRPSLASPRLDDRSPRMVSRSICAACRLCMHITYIPNEEPLATSHRPWQFHTQRYTQTHRFDQTQQW